MKNLFFFLALCLGVASCTDPKSTDGTVPADELASTKDFVASADQDTARHVPLYIHKIPAESELNSQVTAVGAFGQVLQPPMERLEAQALCKSYWVVEGYAEYLTFNEKYPLLTLDSNVDRRDAIWEIQGFAGDQSAMAVVRRNTFGPPFNSLSSKWIELYDRPTREQFKHMHQGL